MTLNPSLAYDNQRRRAKKDGLQVYYSRQHFRDWFLEKMAKHPFCYYCASVLMPDAQIDHKTPLSRGGIYVLENLALCCKTCNQCKGMLTDLEFHALLSLLQTWAPVAGHDVLRRLRSGWKKGRQ